MAKRMNDVVGVFGPEAGKHDPPLIGPAVAVAVFEDRDRIVRRPGREQESL